MMLSCEPDDCDTFVKAVSDEIEAEQHVEVVNKPAVISLNLLARQ